MTVILSQYSSEGLPELIVRLNKDYYHPLEIVCEDATAHAVVLSTDEHHTSTALYSSLSIKLIERVNNLIKNRKEDLIPYINDLFKKKQEGHDCRNCTGGCHVGHNTHLLSLKDSHKQIKEVLFRLQSVAVPLYNNIPHTDTYRQLRSAVTRMDTLLTEMFYLEEANLIPGVFEAQKNIHA